MLERVRAGLNGRKGTWFQIAKDCGVSYSWICKVAQGHIKNPGIVQLQILDDYLRTAA